MFSHTIMFLNMLAKAGFVRTLRYTALTYVHAVIVDTTHVRFMLRTDYLQALRFQAIPWVEAVNEQSYDGESVVLDR